MAAKRIKKKTKTISVLSRSRSWAAVGALAAYAATGAGNTAIAKDRRTPVQQGPASDSVQALPTRRYDIPAGPLDVVLKRFEGLSGSKVSVTNPTLLTIQSPGANGVLTEEQALKRILADTQLEYSIGADHVITVRLKAVSSSVEVKDSAPMVASSMPKYQQPLIDVPQTIGVVSQQVLDEQGATTLRDALRNVVSISLAAGEGGSQGDNLTIRGFTARNDLFIDGMRDFGSYYRDPFNTEEVEVLQGPSSVTFGRGSTGGVVNQASKTPNLDHSISADLAFGTDATRRGTLDLDIPIPQFGPGAAFRLNAMGNIGDVAGRNVAENRRDGFAPSLALGLGTPTRLTLSYFHQNADDIPDYGVPWLFNGPAPVPRDNYYGLKNGNYLRTYDDIGTAKLEHDINDKITVRDQVRYANYVRDALITEPQLTGVKSWDAARGDAGNAA